MLRSKIAMGLLWTFLTLALHFAPGIITPAQAQGSRKDDIVFNSRGIPLSGATVRVCAMPASGQPCSPLALIYSDAALTQALANPTTTDGLGNYFFYAAPGKYEIEISGPGITTKQIPNVILPNDPSSPNFSSISSSGAISAFSLNLTGNLSVTGNTTVIGNLASGSLNLTNQSSPPGTPGSGTINLYTKTADKRLYYKDDTGAEVGPIASGSGAQTNTPNTFTAQQNFDADTRFGGPNPWFDLRKFGGYNSATTPPSTTGSITSGQTTLTLASAQDFANGQGIVVYLAGPNTSLTTPGLPTVTPINLSGGTTTYNYKAVAEDRNGALTAASAAGTTTSGAATIGANNISLTTCVRTSGVATYTATGNHNLAVGAQINISGFSAVSLCNGVKTIASTPTGTTFTTNDGSGAADESLTASAAATVYACNKLDFPSGTYSGNNTLRYWIYRSTGAGAYSLVGVAQGIDPFFIDCGLGTPTVPTYVPATPPGSPQPGYLATTIVSGGGTTSVTLANAASNTATTQTVLHDNSKPLFNCIQAAVATQSGGGTCYIPNPNVSFNYWVFNATTDFTALSRSGVGRILLAGDVQLNQTWVLANSMDVEGLQRQTTSFAYIGGAKINGNAYPLLYFPAGSTLHFNRFLLNVAAPQQIGFLSDENSGAGGSVGFISDDVAYSGPLAIVIKAGFDFYFNRGVISSQSVGSSFDPNPAVLYTMGSPAVVGAQLNQLPYRTAINSTTFDHRGVLFDCSPSGAANFFTHNHQFRNILYESQTAPLLRFNCFGSGSARFTQVAFDDIEIGDTLVGFGTPAMDAQNQRNVFVTVTRGVNSVNNQPLIIAKDSSSFFSGHSQGWANSGNIPYYGETYSNSTIGLTGGNRFFITFAGTPPAPNLSLSAGGSVPVGTISYKVSCWDVESGESLMGPLAQITTTTGNQTVNISVPTLPVGCVGWTAYRDLGQGAGYFRINATPGPVSPTATVQDAVSFTHGDSPPGANNAATMIADSARVAAPLLQHIDTSGFTVSTGVATTLTANRTAKFPDATGTIALKDAAQTWSANQANVPLITPSIAGETVSAAPRALFSVFLPGALTSTWTGATWTPDKAITITRVQAQTKTAPSGCTTNAVVRLTDGTSSVNVTISAAANDSGALTQNYAAASSLAVSVQTAASGCTTSPADANVVVQYRMQ